MSLAPPSHNVVLLATAIVLLTALGGCTERFPLEQLPSPDLIFTVGDTTYIEIVPPFTGFNRPEGILIGRDQLMYVADTQNDRIVMLNLAGQVLGTRTVRRPVCVSQDFRLDLLVGGVVVQPNGDSVGAVFRLKMVPAQHRIENAVMDTVWREPARPRRRFVGIGVLPDNQYLVVRRGPDNASFVDPDSRVLLFDARDRFVTPLGDLVTRAGSGITDINQPLGISVFPNSRDFIITQHSEGVAYGAIWMMYQQSADFEGWLPRYDPARPEHRLIDFVRPNRFVAPEGVTIDGRRGDVFIIDAALDSVFKFDNRGRLRGESFGFHRTAGRMRQPIDAAFFDRTLYVLDREEGRILRFRLSIDFR